LQASRRCIEKNELPILIGADRNWSLLTHLQDALSDAFHQFGIKALSPFNRNVNSVDWDVFWLAHDDGSKQEIVLTANTLAANSRLQPTPASAVGQGATA
jgi:hypothetical protein